MHPLHPPGYGHVRPHHPGSVYSFSGSPEPPTPTIEELVVAVTPAVTGGVVYILKLFC